jgi:hypothetical protein
MYETRWPRPGPAMAAACAVIGLLLGVALGLSSPAREPEAQARVSPERSTRRPATTLPDEFHTVILASTDQQTVADRTARRLRTEGVDDAAVLRQADYPSLGTRFAVFSGRFDSRDEADAHKLELAQLGITNSFSKHVTR